MFATKSRQNFGPIVAHTDWYFVYIALCWRIIFKNSTTLPFPYFPGSHEEERRSPARRGGVRQKHRHSQRRMWSAAKQQALWQHSAQREAGMESRTLSFDQVFCQERSFNDHCDFLKFFVVNEVDIFLAVSNCCQQKQIHILGEVKDACFAYVIKEETFIWNLPYRN